MRTPLPDELQARLATQVESNAQVNQAVQDLLDALKRDYLRKLWAPYSCTALAADAQIATRPVLVRSLVIYNGNGSTRYAQVHNAGNKPGDGQIGILPPLPVLTDTTDSFDLPEEGILFSQGLYVCASTTAAPKTLSTTADFLIYALYRFA